MNTIRDMKIVTSLHTWCWWNIVVVLLHKLDLKQFQVVEAQAVPDADFSAVKS